MSTDAIPFPDQLGDALRSIGDGDAIRGLQRVMRQAMSEQTPDDRIVAPRHATADGEASP